MEDDDPACSNSAEDEGGGWPALWIDSARPQRVSEVVVPHNCAAQIESARRMINKAFIMHGPAIVAVAGPCGCGKTTLARCLAQADDRLEPLQTMAVCDAKAQLDSELVRSFQSRGTSKKRPAWVITDLEECESIAEIKTGVSMISGTGLLVLEMRGSPDCAAGKALKAKTGATVSFLAATPLALFSQAVASTLKRANVPCPTVETIQQMHAATNGDVRAALLRLQLVWEASRKQGWPKDFSAEFMRLDVTHNTFTCVRKMLQASSSDDWTERVNKLLRNNPFASQTVHENLTDAISRRVPRDSSVDDMELAADCMQDLSDAFLMTGGRGGFDHDIMSLYGAASPSHRVVESTMCKPNAGPLKLRMPASMNVSKKMITNRRALGLLGGPTYHNKRDLPITPDTFDSIREWVSATVPLCKGESFATSTEVSGALAVELEKRAQSEGDHKKRKKPRTEKSTMRSMRMSAMVQHALKDTHISRI